MPEAQIQIIGDSAFVFVIEGTGDSEWLSDLTLEQVDINWNINIGNEENDLENLNSNDNFNYIFL